MNRSIFNINQTNRKLVLPLVFGLFLIIISIKASAFCEKGKGEPGHDNFDGSTCHVQMVDERFDFLRDGVHEYLKRAILDPDKLNTGIFFSPADHFDSCDFNNGFNRINARLIGSSGAISFFSPQVSPTTNRHKESDVFAGIRAWGMALHAVQDFYAHSNWVEMTRASYLYNQQIVDNLELFDSSLGPWLEISNDWTLVRPNVITSQTKLPIDWTWSKPLDGNEKFPLIFDDIGNSYWLLMSGDILSPLDGEVCPIEELTFGVFGSTISIPIGIHHDELNKDNQGRQLHLEAHSLAQSQTRHEWCRLLHLASDNDDYSPASVLMGLLVKPGGSPHFADTACSEKPQGNIDVTVSVNRIGVIDDHNLGDTPGKLNFILAMYTDDFRRSDRSQGAMVEVDSGNDVPVSGLPAPVTLCVSPEDQMIATIQGWEDDEVIDSEDERDLFSPLGTIWWHTPISPREDWLEPDIAGKLTGVDELFTGTTHRIGSGMDLANNISSTIGDFILTSDNPALEDIEVEINVSNVGIDTDGDGLTLCQELAAGLDPEDSDSDDDGLDDGSEISIGTNPLKADTDDDGLTDGEEVDLGTNPLLADTDNDGVNDNTDNCPIDANTDQVDFDADGMGDACDPDDDNDGVVDEADFCSATLIPETIPTAQLHNNRYALTGSPDKTIFESNNKIVITTTYTSGCSCEQIVNQADLGQGHIKFGCSKSVLEQWHDLVSH